ncbi:hypothetical protein E2C01_090987 [Portunus trituberculatus]|uniref:Uncharacterized protein n=1 Tax=Portunus trituberculatus TaxID=210409 RepID=A0A5B7JCT6_PORTR|nr:hypothetical protein [Portunus trituberculatus]
MAQDNDMAHPSEPSLAELAPESAPEDNGSDSDHDGGDSDTQIVVGANSPLVRPRRFRRPPTWARDYCFSDSDTSV